jgi:hypothetical protein
LLTACF